MSYIAICLCNKDPDFIFILNGLVYSMPTAMSSVTGNQTTDLFYLLKENLFVKNLLFNLLIMARSFKNLLYLSSCSLPQRRFHRIRSHVLQGTESDLAYTKVSGVVYQYILRFRSLWHPLSSSMLINKQIFSLVISKLISAFSL